MKTNEKKQITNILNAFRLIHKDIRKSFDIMCNSLESNSIFKTWKKKEKGNKNAKEDYRDYTQFFNGDDWYYLNCYGLYNDYVIGFTFVISVAYDENDDVDYIDFLKQLDNNINPNTPMLCIFGVYSPVDLENIKLVDDDDWHYVDSILQFTEDLSDDKKETIKYNEWHDIKVAYLEDGKLKEGYESWYKHSKIKLVHITDISSKEKAEKYIADLINEAK